MLLNRMAVKYFSYCFPFYSLQNGIIGNSSRAVVRAQLGVIQAHCSSTAYSNTWPRTNVEEYRSTWRWRSQTIFHPSRHTPRSHYILINEWLRQKQKTFLFLQKTIENRTSYSICKDCICCWWTMRGVCAFRFFWVGKNQFSIYFYCFVNFFKQ